MRLYNSMLRAALVGASMLAAAAAGAAELKVGYSLPQTSHYGVGATVFGE